MSKKITSAFLSIATAAMLSGAVMPLAASALTVAELQAQIVALQAQLNLLLGQQSTTGYTFSADLKLGSTGADVKNLQIVLNKDSATQVAASGVGSSGSETEYFGSLTKAAVVKFQNKYASDVLSPVGLSAGTGYVGSMTRSKLNALYGGTTGGGTTGGGTTPPPVTIGTGLTVLAGVQPLASLAPDNASRIPFTVVNFTASADGDVTVNSLTVERTGLANDAAFSGIVLLDENGLQVGLEKTLNSVHQLSLSESFVVKAGQTRAMTIAANRGDTSTYAGQIAYLSLVAVNTSATINGALPITGVGHTINETLSLGSVTVARGPLDPGASNTKEIGTNNYIFSSVKVTAGSAEKVRLFSIRWNQSGSAGKEDLANVKTYVDDTAYATTLSSDSKYYTSTFDGGIVIDKGFHKELTLKGDIVGGSARTIDFDIYKRADLYLKGETYYYGIMPPNGTDTSGTDDGAFHQDSNPWFDAYQATASKGTITVAKASTITAQNIAINLANQPLGGFEVEVKGEPITVAQTVFRLVITDATGGPTTAAVGTDLDSVSLFDENGNVVAGPVDATGATTDVRVTFTDTVTYAVGKKVYTLKGKLYVNGTTSGFGNNDTLVSSTTPSTDWTTVKGQTTGETLGTADLQSSGITANTMTVKAGALGISVSSVPIAQTAIAGSKQFLFANYLLDAGSSGEDVKLNSLPLEVNAGANPTKISSCTLYDGSTQLTTGSNIKNPSASASGTSFTLDNSLTIAKGSTKTISLKCDIAGDATADDTYSWGYDATAADPSPSGSTSGQDITETETDSAGQNMTIAASGSYSVADDSTAGYTIVSAGTTGVTLLKLKFSATTEDIDIYRIVFELGSVATNSPEDLVGKKVTLYDEAAPTVSIGEATFSTTDYATSSLIDAGKFKVPAGGSKTMLVKGDISTMSGTVGPITRSGELLIVTYDGAANGLNGGNYGKGASSGVTVDGPAISDIAPSGVRIMKAYPTLAKVDLSTSERVLQTVSGKTLYKFKVTANAGDVYLFKFNFTIGSSTLQATTTNYGLYVFTDSGYSSADTTFSSDGLLNYNKWTNGLGANSLSGATGQIGNVDVYVINTTPATTTYKVPSGTTRYFELRGNVSNVETGSGTEYITIQLEGDAAFPTIIGTPASNYMNTAGGVLGFTDAGINSDADNDFIWSPSSTSTTMSIINLDFTNGYGVVGLPTTNMLSETLTSAN